MKKALSGSMVTILSSGCTVMAGLIALVFMDYKIGVDIGLVLTKGVFISILAVIFLMPAILLLFTKLIQKTEHKNFVPGLKKIGTFAKVSRFVAPILFLVIVASAFTIQYSTLEFNYVAKFAGNGNEIIENENITKEIFGIQNALVVLINDDNTVEEKEAIFNYISNMQVEDEDLTNYSLSFLSSSSNGLALGQLLNASALNTIFGISEAEASMIISNTTTQSQIAGTAYAYEIIETLGTNATLSAYIQTNYPTLYPTIQSIYLQEQVADNIFNSTDYTRLVFNINAEVDSEEAIAFVEALDTYLTSTNVEYYVINNTQNTIETMDIFKVDRVKVELISALGILIIVLLAFRSATIPLILVLSIQGTIWINLAGNALAGNPIFFICYLLGVAIQMGATIDYGILLTDRYVFARKRQNKFEAIKTAIDKSFITVISSGSILTLAAFTIGIVSTVPTISSIGYLIGFGALCASLTILFVLPQLLLIFDKLINKTTYKANFIIEPKK